MFSPSSKSMKLCRGVFFLLVGALCAEAQDSSIDSIFTPLIEVNPPGAAVLVRKNGQTVFTRGYGVSELRTLHKIDAHTNFRLASFSKQFTAMAVMLLVHDGNLRYDENLAEIFPGFPDYGRAITVRHLLTHTSGLADYETLMEEKEKAEGPIWSATKQIHDEDVITLLAQQKSGKFAPGTSWAYSNSSYVVLGLIVAKVSGMPFAEFLHRRIFAPLKMSHTVAYVNGQNTVRDRAYGYSKKDGKWQDTDQSPTSATLGDGGIYSNLLDLARWDDAVTSAKLLPKSEMAPALEPVKLNDGSQPHWPATGDTGDLAPGKPVSYGFGWFLDPLDGRTRMWHPGSTSGFRTVIGRFPEEGLTIVILCNRTDLDPTQLAEKIARAKPQ
jgi:CubicO group peptidase (beta-lactamase class C family)